jgi:catechol 2,3-dioxygenase-like lactoylglutathione lyase family enzyme
MKIHRIDHVGVIVHDLPAAKAFFLDLGLEVLGEWEVEGEWVVDRVIGLDNVKNAAVMLAEQIK